jgi:hypothetical protein
MRELDGAYDRRSILGYDLDWLFKIVNTNYVNTYQYNV